MNRHSLIPVLSSALLAGFALPAMAQAPFTPFPDRPAISTETWTWDKTRLDQEVVEGVRLPVTYSHTGSLASGLHSDSGSSSAVLRLISGPARIDNGLPELPPEPYASGTGTTYAYPVPTGYTGVYGLYAGDTSAYAAMMFPNFMSIYQGTYTQAMVNTYYADGGWNGYYQSFVDGLSPGETLPAYMDSLEDFVAASRFQIDMGAVDAAATAIVFQIRVQGLGPTVSNVLDGTYLSTYDVVRQLSPLTLTYNGTELLSLSSAELLSYSALNVGNRHSYVHAGYEEIWEFRWDLDGVVGPIDEYSISFINYPSAVISGLSVAQIPEPSTWALIGAGALLGAARWRRRG